MILIIEIHVLHCNETLRMTIEKKLENITQKYDPEITVAFRGSEQYWKHPEVTICYFKLSSKSSNKKIDLKEFVKLFNIEYRYIPGEGDAQVIWSMHAHKGQFLDEAVEWVHIEEEYNDAYKSDRCI